MLIEHAKLPDFDSRGNLPPGIHFVTWDIFHWRYGGTARRRLLLRGLREALVELAGAGCRLVYIDGSFVTTKPEPGDFDACWSVEGVDANRLDPVFLTFDNGRAAQKARFGGELFPAELPEGLSGKTFVEFFQTDKNTGDRKGIIAIALELRELVTPTTDDESPGETR